jgi:lysylphosphatidylglycerol synthetase-like protein (DUF2156 family)
MLRILKKIFTSGYIIALFVYLPIIAQITAILSIKLLDGAKNIPILNLPYLLLIFMLIAALGYLFGKKESEERFGASYYVVLALPIYTLICANVAFILSSESFYSGYFRLVAFVSNPTFHVTNFLYNQMGQRLYMFLTPLVSYIAFAVGFTLALKSKGFKIEERSFFIRFALAVLLVLAFGAQYVQKSYSMPNHLKHEWCGSNNLQQLRIFNSESK